MSDGTRTRGRRDHNPELYQLSYAHQDGPEHSGARRSDQPSQVTVLRSRMVPSVATKLQAGAARQQGDPEGAVGARRRRRRAGVVVVDRVVAAAARAADVLRRAVDRLEALEVVVVAGRARSRRGRAMASQSGRRPPPRRGAAGVEARPVPERDPAVAAGGARCSSQPGELARRRPGSSEFAESSCQPPASKRVVVGQPAGRAPRARTGRSPSLRGWPTRGCRASAHIRSDERAETASRSRLELVARARRRRRRRGR